MSNVPRPTELVAASMKSILVANIPVFMLKHVLLARAEDKENIVNGTHSKEISIHFFSNLEHQQLLIICIRKI